MATSHCVAPTAAGSVQPLNVSRIQVQQKHRSKGADVIEEARELMLAARLSKTEQAVFACLATKPNALVRRGEVLAVLKGSAPHTIDSHIMAIRRKLRHHGQDVTIETVTGSGFILRMRSATEAR